MSRRTGQTSRDIIYRWSGNLFPRIPRNRYRPVPIPESLGNAPPLETSRQPVFAEPENGGLTERNESPGNRADHTIIVVGGGKTTATDAKDASRIYAFRRFGRTMRIDRARKCGGRDAIVPASGMFSLSEPTEARYRGLRGLGRITAQ